MIEKLKQRSIRLVENTRDPAHTESAAALLRDVKGILRVRITSPGCLNISYNVRMITLQIIEALLQEFSYAVRCNHFCRIKRAIRYYIEDIESGNGRHDQADNTRDAFITRYLRREHGCRDHRPDYLRRYL